MKDEKKPEVSLGPSKYATIDLSLVGKSTNEPFDTAALLERIRDEQFKFMREKVESDAAERSPDGGFLVPDHMADEVIGLLRGGREIKAPPTQIFPPPTPAHLYDEPEHPHCRCTVDDIDFADMHRAEYMADAFRRFLVAMACIIVAVALGVALLLWVAS